MAGRGDGWAYLLLVRAECDAGCEADWRGALNWIDLLTTG